MSHQTVTETLQVYAISGLDREAAEAITGIKWEELERPESMPEDALWATHDGYLEIGGLKLRLHIMNTGWVVVPSDALPVLAELVERGLIGLDVREQALGQA
jgi:hypothetical protein